MWGAARLKSVFLRQSAHFTVYPKKTLFVRTQTHPKPDPPALRAALHARQHRSTQPLKWRGPELTMCVSHRSCANNILMHGAQELGYSMHPNATRHAV